MKSKRQEVSFRLQQIRQNSTCWIHQIHNSQQIISTQACCKVFIDLMNLYIYIFNVDVRRTHLNFPNFLPAGSHALELFTANVFFSSENFIESTLIFFTTKKQLRQRKVLQNRGISRNFPENLK